jgi:hypothetical protein
VSVAKEETMTTTMLGIAGLLASGRLQGDVTVAGTVAALDVRTIAAGHDWATLTLDDGTGSVDVQVPPKAWPDAHEVVLLGARITVAGLLNQTREGLQVIGLTVAAPLTKHRPPHLAAAPSPGDVHPSKQDMQGQGHQCHCCHGQSLGYECAHRNAPPCPKRWSPPPSHSSPNPGAYEPKEQKLDVICGARLRLHQEHRVHRDHQPTE